MASPMKKLRFSTLICVFGLAGCAAVPSTTSHDIDALGISVSRTICGNGPPTHVETVPNLHVDGVIDTIERRDCTMGSSTFYVSTQASDPTGLAMALEVHHPGSGVPKFLEIGSPVSVALNKLGRPTTHSGDTFTYAIEDDVSEDKFTIVTKSGSISSLVWSWSLD